MKNEIIKDEVKSILNSVAQSENIQNYEVFSNHIPIQGDGFLSEFFTGEVLNKDNGKTINVAIKKAPIKGFNFDLATEDIYRNEIYFYSKLFPQLNKFQKDMEVEYPFDNIPRYLAGDVDSKNIFVAMENIKEAGYTLYDKKKYLDSDHIELIFKTYGKWHALSFSFKRKYEEIYQNLVGMLTNMLVKLTDNSKLIKLMEKSYFTALETFDPVDEADILTKLKTIQNVAETFKNANAYKGLYKCLIHGDCWSNNMMFKYKESGELEDIKLVDFQITYSSTPIHDLSYFFYSGASKKDMDKLDDYLDLYYQSFSEFARELGENPEEIFPLDVLKHEWKEYGVWGIILGCQLWLVKLMDREEIEKVLNQKDLPANEYWTLWKEKMDKIVASVDYREKIRNICLHAVEYGIL